MEFETHWLTSGDTGRDPGSLTAMTNPPDQEPGVTDRRFSFVVVHCTLPLLGSSPSRLESGDKSCPTSLWKGMKMARKCESESSLKKEVTLNMAFTRPPFMSPPLYSQNDLPKMYILPWFPARCHPNFLSWPARLSGLVHPNLSPNPSTPTALHAMLQTLNFPVPQAHRGHVSVMLLVPGTRSLPLSVVVA